MDINFFYKNNQHSYKHEIIIISFATAVSKVIDLPESLEVCLYDLGENVYGGIDMPAALYNCGQEYEYFFRNGAWYYREEGTQDWYNVAEELFGVQNEEAA